MAQWVWMGAVIPPVPLGLATAVMLAGFPAPQAAAPLAVAAVVSELPRTDRHDRARAKAVTAVLTMAAATQQTGNPGVQGHVRAAPSVAGLRLGGVADAVRCCRLDY